jgi:hypothetical protein
VIVGHRLGSARAFGHHGWASRSLVYCPVATDVAQARVGLPVLPVCGECYKLSGPADSEGLRDDAAQAQRVLISGTGGKQLSDVCTALERDRAATVLSRVRAGSCPRIGAERACNFDQAVVSSKHAG